MKQILNNIATSLLAFAATISLQAQNIKMTDIEKATDSYARNYMYSTKNMYAELNGVFYFEANDGIHGDELWRSDGTAKGSYLVKDIKPGPDASNTNDIIVLGNYIYFSANDGVHGQQLWKSDGTPDGTTMVTDLSVYYPYPNPAHLTDVNGEIYFVCDGYFGAGSLLFKTDGTDAGTQLITDIASQYPYGSNASQLTNVNGRLFFVLVVFGFDNQLYTSDGTAGGTHQVADVNPFGYDNVGNLTALNGLCYFSADDGTGKGKLFASDGSAAGTYAVKGKAHLPFWFSSLNNPFTIKNNVLFFQGYDDNYDYELYKFNTANPDAAVKLVKDIVPGVSSSYPSFITNVNGTLFFTIGPAGADAELWKSDGTADGTQLVKDINPGGINYYYGLTNMNGTLMFVFANEALGNELWKSDGTSAGTVLVKDIFPGIYSSFPQYLTYKNGTFIFSANKGNGVELWKSDGSTAGTVLVKDINKSSTSSSTPFNFTAFKNGSKAMFAAGTNKYGYELYSSDGSDAGTNIVKDINEGSYSSSPFLLTAFKNNLYFFSFSKNGLYLTKTNGAAAGTQQFYQFTETGYIEQMEPSDKLVYFTVYNYTTFYQELWRSDGTAAGTYAVKTDLSPYFALSIRGAGDYVYFANFDDANGLELWKSDGTAEGTGIVKDINPGSAYSNPFNLYNFNDKLYFAADQGYGPFLWTTDGTATGTVIVKPVIVDYTAFAQANNKLFFNAFSTVANGYELFATDGSSAGTKLVKDINKGPAGSNSYALTEGDTLMYFYADDGIHGTQLWVTNGLAKNTKLVKYTPDFFYYLSSVKVNVNDILFFVANDTLWQSNGTSAGTHKVQDDGLDGVSNIYNLSSIGSSLYFSGYTEAAGQEVYTTNVADMFAPQKTIADNAQKTTLPAVNTLSVKLLANPFQNEMKLVIESTIAQSPVLSITDASGKVMQVQKITLAAGTNNFSYNTNAWQQGMYTIKVTGNATVAAKAIKVQ